MTKEPDSFDGGLGQLYDDYVKLGEQLKKVQEECKYAWSEGWDSLENEIAEVMGLNASDKIDTVPIVEHVARMMRGRKFYEENIEKIRQEIKDRETEISALRQQLLLCRNMLDNIRYEAVNGVAKLDTYR